MGSWKQVESTHEEESINTLVRKRADKLKAGDHLKLYNGKTAEILKA